MHAAFTGDLGRCVLCDSRLQHVHVSLIFAQARGQYFHIECCQQHVAAARGRRADAGEMVMRQDVAPQLHDFLLVQQRNRGFRSRRLFSSQ